MQLVIQYSNLLTFGNILTVITGIGSVITAVVLLWWKLRNLWLTQQLAYEARIASLINEHTTKIENCIHQLPGHPENPNHVILPPFNE